MKVAIMTDNSSGLTLKEANNLGIKIVNLPFIIEGEQYIENSNLTREEFFEQLQSGASISTSQSSLEVIREIWNSVLEKYDQIVFIPLSSGLSAACESATQLSKEFEGKVEVVNNKRVSVTLKGSIYNALQLAEEGKSAKEIKEFLENDTYNSSIYITVTTLKYLRRGGRITAATAALGTLLSIKPVLQIQGDKLDAYAKVMTMKQAKSKMFSAMHKDLDTRFKTFLDKNEMVLDVAYSAIDSADAKVFAEEVKNEFPNVPFGTIDSLPLTIICHTGPNSLAIACHRNYHNAFEKFNKIADKN